jgi:hypothetical protein
MFIRILRRIAGLFLKDRPRSARYGKQPDEFTLRDVEELPRGHIALMGIACTNQNAAVAALAAQKLTDLEKLRILAIVPEAHNEARMVGIIRHVRDQHLMLQLALRDDNVEIALFAAGLLTNPFLLRRLQESKLEEVRLHGLGRMLNPDALARQLGDITPEPKSSRQLPKQRYDVN